MISHFLSAHLAWRAMKGAHFIDHGWLTNVLNIPTGYLMHLESEEATNNHVARFNYWWGLVLYFKAQVEDNPCICRMRPIYNLTDNVLISMTYVEDLWEQSYFIPKLTSCIVFQAILAFVKRLLVIDFRFITICNSLNWNSLYHLALTASLDCGNIKRVDFWSRLVFVQNCIVGVFWM